MRQKILVIITIAFFIAGCSDAPVRVRNESLSSAAEKSNSPKYEERKVKERDNIVWDNNGRKSEETNIIFSTTPVTTLSTIQPDYAVFAVGYQDEYYLHNIKNIIYYDMNLKFGNYSDNQKKTASTFEGGLTVGKVNFKNSFKQKDDFLNPGYIGLNGKAEGEGTIRGDMKFNLGIGIGTGILGWNYKQALHDSEGIIKGDSIGIMKMWFSSGISYRKKGMPYIKLEAVPELFLPGKYTGEGFTNDLFAPTVGMGYKLEFGGSF